MRIALVTEFYYPHLGGVTEHVHNLARQLNSAGHTALIVTSNMGDVTHDGPHVRRIGTSRIIYSSGSFARITTGVGLRRQLREFFRAERIDVVHVHSGLTPTFGLVAPEAAHDLDLPVVVTFHSWFPQSRLFGIFRGPLQRRLDRHAASIAVSQLGSEAHAQYFETEWDIIPNGVDTDFFRPADRPAGREPGGPRLLFLGRLDPRNGLDVALKAMRAIRDVHPHVRLTVAGDGPLRRHYERAARPLGESVRFIGSVNGDRPLHYGQADVMLVPITKASWSVTLLEAMACAVPMVASDIIGFRQQIDGGREAVMVSVGDIRRWSEATLDLLADPGRRAEMSLAGRTKALQFSWPRITEQVVNVYQRVSR
jgi:phosphatidyl-myo-inositol alpha-mannosyltransferase